MFSMSESAKEPIALHGSGEMKVRWDFVGEGGKLHSVVEIGREELPQFTRVQGEPEIEKSHRTDIWRLLLVRRGPREYHVMEHEGHFLEGEPLAR